MAGLPHPWDAYERVQHELGQTYAITSESWGMEAALDDIAVAVASGATITPADIELSRETAARRERRHRVALARLVSPPGPADTASAALSALTLDEIERSLSPRDRRVLQQLAAGLSYAEIARKDGRRPGALRVCVGRIRSRLQVHLAGPRGGKRTTGIGRSSPWRRRNPVGTRA